MPDLRIRDGRLADLVGLCEIEANSFAADRLSPRSFRRLIGSPSACLRVAAASGGIIGYHVVFTRAGSTVARLYSIAVAATARGKGIGERLLADAERQARRSGAAVLRLEVRPDNAAAIRLYAQRGFERIGTYHAYYADGSDALRYERALNRGGRRNAAGGKDSSDSDEDRSSRNFRVSPHVMKMSSGAAAGCPAQGRRACRAGLSVETFANG